MPRGCGSPAFSTPSLQGSQVEDSLLCPLLPRPDTEQMEAWIPTTANDVADGPLTPVPGERQVWAASRAPTVKEALTADPAVIPSGQYR